MTPALNLVLRDARPRDRTVTVRLLGETFAGSPLACHLDPDPETRPRHCRDRMDAEVADALSHGLVRLAEEEGRLVAAALWLPCAKSTGLWPAPAEPTGLRPAPAEPTGRRPQSAESTGLRPAPAEPTGDLPSAAAPVAARFRELEGRLDARRPRERRYHQLTYLAVDPRRRRLGIGGLLLDTQHRRLDADGIPAYLEADDPRHHRWWLRRGYTDIGAPVLVPGSGCPVWPMWRHPDPATDGRDAS